MLRSLRHIGIPRDSKGIAIVFQTGRLADERDARAMHPNAIATDTRAL